MSISCDCGYDYDITTVGDLIELTCRTPTKCRSCGKDINSGNVLYKWNMYDWSLCQTVAPHWMCEECGNFAENLSHVGFCYDLGYSIRDQWLEYLREYQPNNPAVKGGQ